MYGEYEIQFINPKDFINNETDKEIINKLDSQSSKDNKLNKKKNKFWILLIK